MLHPFHIIKEACKKHNIDCELMAGATDAHATFKMVPGEDCILDWKVTGYGTCHGTIVALGVATDSRKEFDLNEPDSLEKIDKYIGEFGMWAH
ncbi:MAG: hypothetical protein ACXAB4_02385 [Candidatus Hodarchaeales archaeon]|jgi:hypothetical protein